MSAYCRSRGAVPAILLILLPAFGCSRRTPNVPTEGAAQGNPPAFQTQPPPAAEIRQGFSLTDSHGKGSPFEKSDLIPAGALLTVRLQVPLVAGSGFNESFEALLDEPLVVDGNILISRNAIVRGEIESAHVSKTSPDRGYVRLILNSVQVDGASVPVQTASLFARQLSTAPADPVTIRLEKGRRLTFRLKEQIFLPPNTSKSCH